MDADRRDNRHGWHPTDPDPPGVSDDTGEWPPLAPPPLVLREDDGEPDGPTLPAVTPPDLVRETVADWRRRGLLPGPEPVAADAPRCRACGGWPLHDETVCYGCLHAPAGGGREPVRGAGLVVGAGLGVLAAAVLCGAMAVLMRFTNGH